MGVGPENKSSGYREPMVSHELGLLKNQFVQEPGESTARLQLADRCRATLRELHKNHVIQRIFRRLDELPQNLPYHNKRHSYEVMTHAVLLALKDGKSSREVELIAIAAAGHDTGFVSRPKKNEKIGADFTAMAMTRKDKDGQRLYSADEIRAVRRAIMDTELKPDPARGTVRQVSTSELSRYLLDADLANFGLPSFQTKSELVLRENLSGKDPDDKQRLGFLRASLRLLSAHNWQTQAAAELFSAGKERNVNWLQKEISRLSAECGAESPFTGSAVKVA